MIVGFTGTRFGWTYEQERAVRRVLLKLCPELVVHGGCVGSDEQFDNLAIELGLCRRVYPASNLPDKFIAGIRRTNDVEFMDAAPAPGRNLFIVAEADIMLGCPHDDRMPRDLRGQGTWYTIRHTRERMKPLLLIPPQGLLMEERLTPEMKDLLNTRIRLPLQTPVRPRLRVRLNPDSD